MEINYSWIIVQLDCKPNVDGMQDYVVAVHWRYLAQSGEYSIDTYGVQSFEVNQSGTFIPYNDLTEEIVIGWLEDSLDVPTMQTNLAIALQDVINPPIIHPPLPWLN